MPRKVIQHILLITITLLGADNVHQTSHLGPYRPPIIRPIYYFVHSSKDTSKNDGTNVTVTIPLPPNFDGKLRLGLTKPEPEPLERADLASRPPFYGDPAIIEDPDDIRNRNNYIWSFSKSMIPLSWTRTRRKKIHRHHLTGRHDLDGLTYDDYMDQMYNTAKGLDPDGIEIQDVHAYKVGYGDGWNGDEYWLTDDEILHSKGYKKYRKHLKKKAKLLKASVKFTRWFQKFLAKKVTKLDVIAPW